jgi:hypothetical protein
MQDRIPEYELRPFGPRRESLPGVSDCGAYLSFYESRFRAARPWCRAPFEQGSLRSRDGQTLKSQCSKAQNHAVIDKQWFEYNSSASVYNTTEDVSMLEPIS